MPETNAKTVRLGRGRHPSPDRGACVVELASMLAGEPFSDRPRSVSPVIRDFLHDYNDALDYRRRQDLLACAAAVVSSRGSRAEERGRARSCLALVDELRGSGPRGPMARLERLSFRFRLPAAAGAHAAQAAVALGGPDVHRRALRFVDELVGRPSVEEPAVLPVEDRPVETVLAVEDLGVPEARDLRPAPPEPAFAGVGRYS